MKTTTLAGIGLTYRLESPPDGASILPVGLITWVPSEAQGPGTYTIKTIVTDYNPLALINQRLSATNSFTVTVNEINVAPSLTLPPDAALDELTLLSVNASATDSDIPTNGLTFELVAGPPNLVISPSGAITWRPTEAQGPGVYPVTVRVTDTNPDAVNEQHLGTTNTFSVTVNEANIAPVLVDLTNITVNPGQAIAGTATATDADVPPNSLTFSLLNPPSGAAIDGSTGRFNWRPTVAQANTTNVVQVQVMDDSPWAVNERHLSDTKSFTVIVNPIEPVLLTAISLTGGQFQTEVSGMVGPDYVIQAATAFSDWQNLWTNTPTVVPFSFIDTNAGSLSNCFYRVLLSP